MHASYTHRNMTLSTVRPLRARQFEADVGVSRMSTRRSQRPRDIVPAMPGVHCMIESQSRPYDLFCDSPRTLRRNMSRMALRYMRRQSDWHGWPRCCCAIARALRVSASGGAQRRRTWRARRIPRKHASRTSAFQG